MPLPRYMPVRKKAKVVCPSIDDLDDYCLSKIIGHALTLSSLRDEEVRDNGKTERNLSLVSKRWFFLTQIQVANYGVHRLNLDRIPRVETTTSLVNKKLTSNIAYVPHSCRKQTPSVLMQKNIASNSMIMSQHKNQSIRTNLFNQPTQPTQPIYGISLFRSIQPKLLKYKHIQIDGTLSGDEFKKLIVALNAARTEQLIMKIKVEKDRTPARDFAIIPKQLYYLQKLTLYWCNDTKNDYSNGLTWTVFERAVNLRELQVHLVDDELSSNSNETEELLTTRDTIEKISSKFLDQSNSHHNLDKIIFIRSSSECSPDCGYNSLIRNVLKREQSVHQVDTNDCILIENLIKSSDRICTTRELKRLKFSSPIKSIELLAQLMCSRNLGKDYLSIVIDNINQIEDVRLAVENFSLTRHPGAICQLFLSLKDQKYSDCEDKIKNLVHLSRLADVIVNMNAQQRVSIDCCHLMWSVGRALQSTDIPGRCLFKIKLQVLPLKHNANNYTEITVPFGKGPWYKINSNREDLTKHREIMRALKKDCYHQFVKSVRD